MVDADPLWIDAVGGAPAYNATELRRIFSAFFYRGSSLLYSARPGVIPLSGVEPVTISGMTVTVADIAAVISPNLGDPKSGSYVAAIPQTALSVTPADGALPRKDVVVARVEDDVIDGSGGRRAFVDIITGAPASSPSEPLHTGMVRIATVDVPAGSSTPTVSNNSFTTCMNGGILQTRGSSYYPTLNQRQGNYLDDAALDLLMRYTGSSWVPVASEDAYNGGIATGRADGSTNSSATTQNTKDTWESLGGGPSVTVVIGPSGKCKVEFGAQAVFPTDNNTGRLAQLRVSYSGANSGTTSGDDWEMRNQPLNFSQAFTSSVFLEGLNPGSTTFTLQYYNTAETGGCTWDERKIIVEPK